MIGHTFASSEATVLFIAPSPERIGDYLLIASTRNAYAVAVANTSLLTASHGAPDHWLSSESYPDLETAATELAKRTNLTVGNVFGHARSAEFLLSVEASFQEPAQI